MANKLEQVTEALVVEEERLKAELAALEEQGKAVALELRRVQQALGALQGRGRAGKGLGKPEKPSGRGLTVAEVVPLIESLLKREGPLTETELARRVGEEAKRLGKTGTGLHFLVRKALQEGKRFSESEGGWQLASKEKQLVP
jgi:hypothetical protein